MSKRIITPFGQNNPDVVIPTTTPNGAESLELGYTAAHELPLVAGGLPLNIDVQNQLHKDAQTFIKTTQNETAVKWYSAADNNEVPMNYISGAEVHHNGALWVSVEDNNNSEPSIGAGWVQKTSYTPTPLIEVPDTGMSLSSSQINSTLFVPFSANDLAVINLPPAASVPPGSFFEIYNRQSTNRSVSIFSPTDSIVATGEAGSTLLFYIEIPFSLLSFEKTKLVAIDGAWHALSDRLTDREHLTQTTPERYSIHPNGYFEQFFDLTYSAASGAAGQVVGLAFPLVEPYLISGISEGTAGNIVTFLDSGTNAAQFTWVLRSRHDGSGSYASGDAKIVVKGDIAI